MNESFYDIFNINYTFSQEEIDIAYHRCLDNLDAAEIEKRDKIDLAYKTLTNSILRKQYDKNYITSIKDYNNKKLRLLSKRTKFNYINELKKTILKTRFTNEEKFEIFIATLMAILMIVVQHSEKTNRFNNECHKSLCKEVEMLIKQNELTDVLQGFDLSSISVNTWNSLMFLEVKLKSDTLSYKQKINLINESRYGVIGFNIEKPQFLKLRQFFECYEARNTFPQLKLFFDSIVKLEDLYDGVNSETFNLEMAVNEFEQMSLNFRVLVFEK